MKHDIDWSKSHCGVILCTYDETVRLMPEVKPILDELPNTDKSADFWVDKLIDVKVHMLMPGQFPCIPNWHVDFRPRGEDGKVVKGWSPDYRPMYLWLSGPPLTLYKGQGEQPDLPAIAQTWHPFWQADLHRGQASEEHCWRCFIRVIPRDFVATHAVSSVRGTVRRHCQVYLDASSFTW